MILRLSEVLDVPLRERNDLLLAAGLAPAYPERALDDATLAPFASIIRQMLERHEPYPAFVIDRWWRMVDQNRASARLVPQPAPGSSLVEVFFGEAYQQLIDNWSEVAWTGLRQLRREAAAAPNDVELTRLLTWAESRVAGSEPVETAKAGTALVVCPTLQIAGRTIQTVSTMVRFSSAQEVTLDELRVELIFPADEAAAAFFRDVENAHA